MEPSAIEPARRAGCLQAEETEALAHNRRRDPMTIFQAIDSHSPPRVIAQDEIHSPFTENLQSGTPHVVRETVDI